MILRATAFAVLASLLGTGALWLETDGFRAITAETARRIRVAREPVSLPEAALETASHQTPRLQDLAERPLIVGFVYTRCPTICLSLGESFQRLQDGLKREGAPEAGLLSISFDPEADTPERLAEYGRDREADPTLWTFARIRDPEALRRVLDAFGIVVIPDEFGGFTHNAALHVVERGRLARILDPEDVAGALAALRR